MSRQYQKKNQQTGLEAIVFGVFRVIGEIFKLIFRIGKKRGLSTDDRQYIRGKRSEIEDMMRSDNIHAMKQAVFEADKLVDFLLKANGYRGETMADRLKDARGIIDHSVYEGIWQGHKVRNQLAHEHDTRIASTELKGAVEKLLRYIKSV